MPCVRSIKLSSHIRVPGAAAAQRSAGSVTGSCHTHAASAHRFRAHLERFARRLRQATAEGRQESRLRPGGVWGGTSREPGRQGGGWRVRGRRPAARQLQGRCPLVLARRQQIGRLGAGRQSLRSKLAVMTGTCCVMHVKELANGLRTIEPGGRCRPPSVRSKSIGPPWPGSTWPGCDASSTTICACLQSTAHGRYQRAAVGFVEQQDRVGEGRGRGRSTADAGIGMAAESSACCGLFAVSKRWHAGRSDGVAASLWCCCKLTASQCGGANFKMLYNSIQWAAAISQQESWLSVKLHPALRVAAAAAR